MRFAVLRFPGSCDELDLVVLDQRICEELLAHLLDIARVDHVELDHPPDVDVRHPLEAERGQCPLDCLSLWIEDARLGADQHARACHAPVRSNQAWNGSPAMRSYAST